MTATIDDQFTEQVNLGGDISAEVDPLGARVRWLHAAIDSVHDLDLTRLTDTQLINGLREYERAWRRHPTARHEMVTEISARGIPAKHGARNTAAFLRMLLRVSTGEANGWLRDADDLAPRRSLTTGEALPPDLPATAAAAAAGEISPAQQRIIGQTMRHLPAAVDTETRAAAEQRLVEYAAQFDPVLLGRVAARLVSCLDPDGKLDREADRQDRRELTIGRQDRHGMHPLHGLLDPETGALVKAMLEPLAAPRHTATERDQRTGPQRQHDALREAARLLLASGQLSSQGGVAATLLLIATLDDLGFESCDPDATETGTAETDAEDADAFDAGHRCDDTANDNASAGVGYNSADADSADADSCGADTADAGTRDYDLADDGTADAASTASNVGDDGPTRDGTRSRGIERARTGRVAPPHGIMKRHSGFVRTGHGDLLPISDAVRWAANAGIVPMVFDTDGAPLWVGRDQRLATRAQRLALFAQDRGCVLPGCDVPAIRTEVMHLDDWARGGRTDIDHLALGCSYHHRHSDGWALQRIGGRIWCTPPPWIDPTRTPRLNTTFHDPNLFDQIRGQPPP